MPQEEGQLSHLKNSELQDRTVNKQTRKHVGNSGKDRLYRTTKITLWFGHIKQDEAGAPG